MRSYSDTIFALSTNKAKSALAIFRISGKLSIKIINKIISKKKIKTKKPTLCYLFDNNKNIIDQVIITAYKKPKSYTGEDMIEISCHGSIAVINKISEILINNKIRLAEAGEFTKRALINDKLSVLEAESINELVNSETENQRKLAISNYGGKLDEYVKKIINKLSKLIADVEAFIDFTDEDLPQNLHKSLKKQKKTIVSYIETIIKKSQLSKQIIDGFKVTVIGKPNTGKSSFINYINNKEVSIVTNIAGTTTDLITSNLEIGGDKYTFVDTAGIRKYKNLIEKIGIEKSIESAEKSDVSLVFLQNNEKNNYKNIKNKLFVRSKYDKNKRKIKGVESISSISGYGIGGLLVKISKKIKKKPSSGPSFSRERHIANLKNSLFYIKKADFKEIDISAENLRRSLVSIQNINQKFDIEKILDIIFSDFCIGK